MAMAVNKEQSHGLHGKSVDGRLFYGHAGDLKLQSI